MNIFKYSLHGVLGGLILLNGCRAVQDDVTVGEAVDDVRITTEVKAAIVANEDLNPLEINVDSIDGTVILSGIVGEESDIAEAADVARSVGGVRSVQNNLTVDQ